MKKGIVGFIFGVLSIVAMIIGILSKMSKVTNVVSHMKDDISDGLKFLLFGENAVTRLHKYSGRYPFNGHIDYTKYTPYNSYSASFNYSNERQDSIESITFDTATKAKEVFEKLVEVSDGKKLTVEQFLNVADPHTDFVTRKYLDSKFGWHYDEFFGNHVRIQKSFEGDTWYISVPRPVRLIEEIL